MGPQTLEVAVFKQEGTESYIARAVQYDFVGEGDSEREALSSLARAVRAEFEFAKADGRKPFEGLPKPPEGFLTWWKGAKAAAEVRELGREMSESIPPPWMIVAMERVAHVR